MIKSTERRYKLKVRATKQSVKYAVFEVLAPSLEEAEEMALEQAHEDPLDPRWKRNEAEDQEHIDQDMEEIHD